MVSPHRVAQKLDDSAERLWYARQAREEGWSHNVLVLQIEGRAHARPGKALTNFKATLPPGDSDLAQQVFKDPYGFDFLGTADPQREREVEQVLIDHFQRFLLELGSGFAFVGRQVHFEAGDGDFYIDLCGYFVASLVKLPSIAGQMAAFRRTRFVPVGPVARCC